MMKILPFLHTISFIHQHKEETKKEDILIIYLLIISDTFLCKSPQRKRKKKKNTFQKPVCGFAINVYLEWFLPHSCHSGMSKATRMFYKWFYYSQLSTEICYKRSPSERPLIFFLNMGKAASLLAFFHSKITISS